MEFVAGVAAIRAKAAPAKTPPRITNGPTLLTGLAVCDNPGCGRGLSIGRAGG